MGHADAQLAEGLELLCPPELSLELDALCVGARLRLVRALVAMAAVGVAVVGAADPAAAHTHLETSEPAEGAVLDEAPERVVIDFSEALDAGLTTARITGEDGAPVELPAQLDADDASTLVLRLPALPDGVYRVADRAFGTSDLHEVSGSIVFGVGAAPAVAGGESASDARPGEVLARTATHLSLGLVAAGLLLLAAVTRVRLPDDGRERAARALRRATGAVAAAVALGLTVRRAARRHPVPGRARRAEAIVAVAVVALGGLLAATPPATGPAFDPPPPAPAPSSQPGPARRGGGTPAPSPSVPASCPSSSRWRAPGSPTSRPRSPGPCPRRPPRAVR